MKFEFQRNRWTLDVFPRIALGSTHSTADISGSTRTTTPAGVESTAVGGLLALSSNIGHYAEDNFAVVPELDLKLGFQFTRHTRCSSVTTSCTGARWPGRESRSTGT